MRYLVTGGAGFIGSHLVEALVALGEAVTVLDDLSTGNLRNLLALRDRIQFLRGSVTDPAVCQRAMEGVDFVFHHAALTSVPRSVDEPVAAHEINTAGTLNVLLAARSAGVRRVVYAGSTAAYGDARELPNHEDMPARPLSPYAATKLAAEEYCRALSATYGLETVTLRYFNVFGPRQDPASPYAAVIPRFILAALCREPPVIYGDGGQTRDFVYVADVVRANLLACKAPAQRVVGQVFNVGCGEAVGVGQLWERIQHLTGIRLAPRYAPGRVGEVRDSRASIERIRTAIGYTPDTDLEAGLRLTIDYYREVEARRHRETAVGEDSLSLPLHGRAPRAALPG
ncbi:MAG TPA: SDR family oxidoreductase [Gemmatimonadales bacterium]